MEKWKGLCALHRKWVSDTGLQAAHFQELLSRYFDNAHSLCLLPSCSSCTLCASACSQTHAKLRGRIERCHYYVCRWAPLALYWSSGWQNGVKLAAFSCFCCRGVLSFPSIRANTEEKFWLQIVTYATREFFVCMWSCSSETVWIYFHTSSVAKFIWKLRLKLRKWVWLLAVGKHQRFAIWTV